MKFVLHRTNARIIDAGIVKVFCTVNCGLVLPSDFRKVKEKTPNT